MDRDFITKIINDISELPEFAQEDRPNPPCLTIFLLFCTDEQQDDKFSYRVSVLSGNKKAIRLLNAENIVAEDSLQVDEGFFINTLTDWINEADVSNRIDLNICPIIKTDRGNQRADIKKQITPILVELDRIIKENEMKPFWIPFVTNVANIERHSEALKEMVECLAVDSRCCKVCVFSQTSETGATVSDTFVADVVISTALFHSCDPSTITKRVLYKQGEPVLYTSSVIFILQHMTKPILDSICSSIDSMVSTTLEHCKKDFDINFANNIVRNLYNGMPRNKNNQISLTPLYGVMLGNNHSKEEFEERLWEFAKNSFLQLYERNKESAFDSLHEQFFCQFKETEQPISLLRDFIEGKVNIKPPTSDIKIAPFPDLPTKNKINEDYINVYKKVADKLTKELEGLGNSFFTEYINSEQFATVLNTYDSVIEQLSVIKEKLLKEINNHEESETLPVVLPESPEIFKNFEFRKYIQNAVDDILKSNDLSDSIVVLLDEIYNRCVSKTKDLRVKYLEILSEGCNSPNGILSQNYLKIAEKILCYPIPKSLIKRECDLVWGRKSNNFLTMWASTHIKVLRFMCVFCCITSQKKGY